jgi:predicted nucleic acid-binding protein
VIVADCSVIVDALVGPDPEALVERLSEDRLVAPALVDFEFVSTIRGLALGRHVSEHRAQDALTDFDALSISRWVLSDPLRRRVHELRHNLTAYDASYVVLAEALECPLVTRDQRLAKAAKDLVEVSLV